MSNHDNSANTIINARRGYDVPVADGALLVQWGDSYVTSIPSAAKERMYMRKCSKDSSGRRFVTLFSLGCDPSSRGTVVDSSWVKPVEGHRYSPAQKLFIEKNFIGAINEDLMATIREVTATRRAAKKAALATAA